jgi:predicted transcriptional regulator
VQTGVLELNLERGAETFRALASETRLRILDLLGYGDRNINEIGAALGLAQPTVTKHMQVLEQVGLVACEYRPGAQGMQKRCRLVTERVLVSLGPQRVPEDCIEEVSMPVGLFTRAEPRPTCGIADTERIIGFLDEPQSFFSPDRATARLLWMADGYVEYTFPNTLPTSMRITRLEFAVEVCSECPDYNNDYPSDLTVWVNGVEIGTWTSPGDLGGKRGRLNPPWWSDHMTQHGLMKVWSVDESGSYVDGLPVSDATVGEVGIESRGPIVVRLGIKEDAQHIGGFNLFGRGFGNYDQDPTVRLHYVPKHNAHRRTGAGGSNGTDVQAWEGGRS